MSPDTFEEYQRNRLPADTSLLIHRSQITEINDSHIVVRTTAKKVEPVMQAERRTYVNPFRSSSPQPDTTDLA